MWLRRMRMGRSLLFVMGCLPPLLNLTAFPIALTKAGILAGLDKVDPAKPCVAGHLLSVPRAALRRRTKLARVHYDA
jgi:hypothetical protein